MQESIYERIHKTLTWKRIVGFNVVLFLILIVPLSVRLAQQDTENRSGAAGELEAPPVIPPPNYPAGAPTIERVGTFFGKTGDTVVLVGSNFGDYQWGSHVYVGATEAPEEAIVRWSNAIIEVKIPDTARTGKVWVVVNGQQANWEGNLLLYETSSAAKIGLQKITSGEGRISVSNATGAVRGMVELAYVSDPITIRAGSGVLVTGQVAGSDSLSKKTTITFEMSQPLPSSEVTLAEYSYPGIGTIEIIRAELYGQNGALLPIYADPLSLKLVP